ncbi:MAG: hypothetical protein WDN02_05205 [Methylovirgula sp.]|uniref:hypothetical protein n=1 Tax=Methylovirgula sp. TaxID=1978224 RepID=UPI003075FF6F
MGRRAIFDDDDFRRDQVDFLLACKIPITRIAERLEIDARTIGSYRRQRLAENPDYFKGFAAQKLTPFDLAENYANAQRVAARLAVEAIFKHSTANNPESS